MPGGDRTGPRGFGPMTGRRAGYCAGYDRPGFDNPHPGYGMRYGGSYGGMHLANASMETLAHVISMLKEDFREEIPKLDPNHCTGERAILALSQAFGELVQPCPTGTVLNF